MAIEEPSYQVLRSADGYELRRYAGYCVAETEVSAPQADVGNAGFRILAKYIFGGNATKASIAMTAPVIQAPSEKIAMTAPVIQQKVIQQGGSAPDRYIVAFTMPAKYTLANLPIPDDKRVRLRAVDDRVVAVRTYRGGWSLSRYGSELKLLRDAMARDGVSPLGEPQWARYNSPFSLPFMRRNEIWLQIDPRHHALN